MRGNDCVSVLVYILSVCTFRFVWTFSSRHVLMANCLGGAPRPVLQLQQSITRSYIDFRSVIYRSLPKEHTCSVLHLSVCLSLCTCPAAPHCLSFFKASKPADLQLQHSSVERWGPLLPCRLQISIQFSCHSMARLLHLLIRYFYFMDFCLHFLSTDVSLWRKIFGNSPRININGHTSRVCMFIAVDWWDILVTKSQCFWNRREFLKVCASEQAPVLLWFSYFSKGKIKFCPEGWRG